MMDSGLILQDPALICIGAFRPAFQERGGGKRWPRGGHPGRGRASGMTGPGKGRLMRLVKGAPPAGPLL